MSICYGRFLPSHKESDLTKYYAGTPENSTNTFFFVFAARESVLLLLMIP